ncbi:RidA family protein [Yoonia sp. R2331]|uniref:RidA family protein n=1 Tax=Yoonia sp. R2331 TaxID=3237238 RepID=UPI0034E462FF
MTPREGDALIFHGAIGAADDPGMHRAAVELAASNAIAAAEGQLAPNELLTCILSMTVFMAAEPGFKAHAAVADHASRFIEDRLGPDAIGTRAAVGVASLPGDAAIEICLVASAGNKIG